MNFSFDQDRRDKVLGRGQYKIDKEIVCFLPFRGEFGWYLMNFVKRVHGFNHSNKWVFCKPGHEVLFPSATKFFYDWSDVPDDKKAGVVATKDEDWLKFKILTDLNLSTDQIHFCSPLETSWEEKLSLAEFAPELNNRFDNNLQVDIVLTPRHRKIDPLRNWKPEIWQALVYRLKDLGYSVGICGAKDSTFPLLEADYYSYDYVNVDSDVELMKKSKLVVTCESGLLYLSFLCKSPTICLGLWHGDLGSILHRPKNVFFKECRDGWENPEVLVQEIIGYMTHSYDI